MQTELNDQSVNLQKKGDWIRSYVRKST